MCTVALNDIKTFYQQDFINYRGVTADTNQYFTEVVAEFIINHIDEFKNTIPCITRASSYKVEGHDGIYSENSNRDEEIHAMKVFNQSKTIGEFDYIGNIIDYQTPLKSSKTDVAGKIDLLAYNGKILRILELKKRDSVETMLRCVIEGYTYLKTVDTQKLIKDFDLPSDTIVKASPFVFKDGIQYKEMQENRTNLNKLIELLDSKPYYIIYKDDKYFVENKS